MTGSSSFEVSVTASSSLDGIRVLDLSRLLPGPACTWYLQGLGAKVDRIEPLGGDLARHIPLLWMGLVPTFAVLLREKIVGPRYKAA